MRYKLMNAFDRDIHRLYLSVKTDRAFFRRLIKFGNRHGVPYYKSMTQENFVSALRTKSYRDRDDGDFTLGELEDILYFEQCRKEKTYNIKAWIRPPKHYGEPGNHDYGI